MQNAKCSCIAAYTVHSTKYVLSVISSPLNQNSEVFGMSCKLFRSLALRLQLRDTSFFRIVSPYHFKTMHGLMLSDTPRVPALPCRPSHGVGLRRPFCQGLSCCIVSCRPAPSLPHVLLAFGVESNNHRLSAKWCCPLSASAHPRPFHVSLRTLGCDSGA